MAGMAEGGIDMGNKSSNQGRRSRRKGHNFEREVAAAFRLVFPMAKRHLEYQADEANGVDLVNTGRYRVQCKKLKKYAPITAIQEVEHSDLFGEVPVLVTAGDGLTPMAVIPFAHFLELLKITEKA